MVNLPRTMRTSEFDSSDEETEEEYQLPVQVTWLPLSMVNSTQFLGICALPGCKFKDVRRNLQKDIEALWRHSIQDVFVFCTKGEMGKYRVPGLLESYQQQGFTVHHYPFPDGNVPDISSCSKILEELRICLENDKKTLIQCYGGLGRSCLIAACLLLQLSDAMFPEQAIDLLRELRGAGAIQTVKQYNYLHDFRENMANYLATKEDSATRSVSR
ncbi:cyclin-dependent kinase inhibitor 3 isoform X1 [Callorhinchus milii]|uniref:Cyclin-dependent kinase inhibitor 3 n=2 Tax=Callorhinchus milii TaxID=7868 RepID=K4FTM0_CALMI|nr:cyclin-dependent kinase inhibitor 3 isoform X1 [Callorhinchus milii]AFK11523.1 cyclin-dependent kinase inhibitor 3 isoform 1 [Callorhinchus milii]|eukprot:gi/632942303/ref/XP_007886338.1/ PREDICTED: cyclin-dependent kinase inhibitor 3 [Callorhinchus milii]